MKRRTLLGLLGFTTATAAMPIAAAAPATAKPLPMWVEEELGDDGKQSHLRLKARCQDGTVVTIIRWRNSGEVRKELDWIGIDVEYKDGWCATPLVLETV